MFQQLLTQHRSIRRCCSSPRLRTLKPIRDSAPTLLPHRKNCCQVPSPVVHFLPGLRFQEGPLGYCRSLPHRWRFRSPACQIVNRHSCHLHWRLGCLPCRQRLSYHQPRNHCRQANPLIRPLQAHSRCRRANRCHDQLSRHHFRSHSRRANRRRCRVDCPALRWRSRNHCCRRANRCYHHFPSHFRRANRRRCRVDCPALRWRSRNHCCRRANRCYHHFPTHFRRANRRRCRVDCPALRWRSRNHCCHHRANPPRHPSHLRHCPASYCRQSGNLGLGARIPIHPRSAQSLFGAGFTVVVAVQGCAWLGVLKSSTQSSSISS